MPRVLVFTFLLGFAGSGCTLAVEDQPSQRGSDSPVSSARAPEAQPVEVPPTSTTPDPDAQPDDPSHLVMQKVCASPCAGRFARVVVLRNAEGRATRLRFDGDIESCSHPPRIYFDAEGNETLTIPNEPVIPDSPEAKDYAAKQAAQTEGLREAETLTCFDAGRCEAGRVPDNMRSDFACRSDSDCRGCACAPVNQDEWQRRGGPESCNIAGEECIATNPACCGGRCVLAR